jgi:hypothetical protein
MEDETFVQMELTEKKPFESLRFLQIAMKWVQWNPPRTHTPCIFCTENHKAQKTEDLDCKTCNHNMSTSVDLDELLVFIPLYSIRIHLACVGSLGAVSS